MSAFSREVIKSADTAWDTCVQAAPAGTPLTAIAPTANTASRGPIVHTSGTIGAKYVREDFVADPGVRPSRMVTRDEVLAKMEAEATRVLGVPLAEALRQLDAGELHGTLIESQLAMLRSLLR
jgi:hypothetical protein